ncbi:MAG: hypothetical protein ABEH66_06470 [Halobacteriales archaeon]
MTDQEITAVEHAHGRTLVGVSVGQVRVAVQIEAEQSDVGAEHELIDAVQAALDARREAVEAPAEEAAEPAEDTAPKYADQVGDQPWHDDEEERVVTDGGTVESGSYHDHQVTVPDRETQIPIECPGCGDEFTVLLSEDIGGASCTQCGDLIGFSRPGSQDDGRSDPTKQTTLLHGDSGQKSLQQDTESNRSEPRTDGGVEVIDSGGSFAGVAEGDQVTVAYADLDHEKTTVAGRVIEPPADASTGAGPAVCVHGDETVLLRATGEVCRQGADDWYSVGYGGTLHREDNA